MGKVYTVEQVSEGHFPQRREHFEHILDLIHQELTGRNEVVGAIIGGSAATGSFRLNSDIDAWIIIDHRYLAEARRLVRAIYTAAAKLFVPLDLVVVRDDVARSGVHQLSAGYTQAFGLAANQTGVIGTNPLNILKLPRLSIKQEATAYIGRKQGKFEAWLGGSAIDPIKHCEFLEEVLDTPIHIARRLLDVRQTNLRTGTSAEVVQAFKGVDPGMSLMLEQLQLLKSTYARGLELYQQLRSHDAGQYPALLEHIEEFGGLAYEFCLQATRMVKKL